MYFEKFLSNMKSMFTKFEDNYELLTEAQKILLLFQKVQISSLTQFNNSLQLLYDLDQDKSTTFDLIVKSMTSESANLPEKFPNLQASGV